MQEQKDKISFDDRIINWVSSNLFYSFLILVLIILIILLFVFGITALIYKDPTILNPNEIGDAIGGMTAPIIGLFSAFLVYIAFREQKRANDEIIKQNNNVIFDKYINIIDKLVEKFQKVEIEESTFRTTDPMLKGKKALEYIFFDEYIK
jgi:membrane protein implicated in regulation of membrane protease activity